MDKSGRTFADFVQRLRQSRFLLLILGFNFLSLNIKRLLSAPQIVITAVKASLVNIYWSVNCILHFWFYSWLGQNYLQQLFHLFPLTHYSLARDYNSPEQLLFTFTEETLPLATLVNPAPLYLSVKISM